MRYSIIPVRAVEDPQLQRAALRVLLSLGAYTDRDGYCYPSQSTIARRLRVSRQAVNRQIKVLVRLGYLQVTHRKNVGGGETSCLYRIHFEDPVNLFSTERGIAGDENERDSQVEEVTASLGRSHCPTGIQETTDCLEDSSHNNGRETYTCPISGATSIDAPGVTPYVAHAVPASVSASASPEVAQTTQLTPHIPKKKNGANSRPNRNSEAAITPPSPPSNQPIDFASHSQEGRIMSTHPPIPVEDFSRIPDHFPEALSQVKSSIPRNPLEAQVHPDLKLYIALTAFTPAASDYQAIIEVLHLLRSRYPTDQSLTDYLAPFWQKWCKSRRRNGSRYSRTNIAWLTEWACNNHMPAAFPDVEELMVSQDPGVYQHAMEPKPEPVS